MPYIKPDTNKEQDFSGVYSTGEKVKDLQKNPQEVPVSTSDTGTAFSGCCDVGDSFSCSSLSTCSITSLNDVASFGAAGTILAVNGTADGTEWVADVSGDDLGVVTDSTNAANPFVGADLTAPTLGSNGLTTSARMVCEEWLDVSWLFVSDDSGATWGIIKKFPVAISGCSDEGTTTTVPSSVSAPDKEIYIWDVDTSGGDLTINSIPAITGVKAGAKLVFRNTGENNILVDQDIDGTTATYTVQGLGGIITVCVDGAGGYQVIS